MNSKRSSSPRQMTVLQRHCRILAGLGNVRYRCSLLGVRRQVFGGFSKQMTGKIRLRRLHRRKSPWILIYETRMLHRIGAGMREPTHRPFDLARRQTGTFRRCARVPFEKNELLHRTSHCRHLYPVCDLVIPSVSATAAYDLGMEPRRTLWTVPE